MRAPVSIALTACALAFAAAAFAQAAGDTPPATDSTKAPAAAPAPATMPPPVAAPATPAPASTAGLLGANSPTPTRPHLAIARAESAIRGERDQMQAIANAADGDLLEARKQQVTVRATVEIKKKEIESLGDRIRAAKQAKDDVTRKSIEIERKRQQSIRDYFDAMLDVAAAGIDEAQARGELARTSVQTCDLELQLVGRAGNASYDSDPALFKVEQQFLESVKLRGAGQEKLATRTQTLADKKLRVYRAWAEFLGGR